MGFVRSEDRPSFLLIISVIDVDDIAFGVCVDLPI